MNFNIPFFRPKLAVSNPTASTLRTVALWGRMKLRMRWLLQKIGKLIRAFWLTINVIACLFFLLSCLAPYVNPGTIGVLPFFGLGLPLVFASLGVLLLLGVFINKKVALLPLFFLIMGSYNIHNYVPIFPQPHIASSHYENISIMSWNVMNFDLLNTHHQQTSTKDTILAVIAREQPDVLMLQEFYSGDGIYNTREALKRIYPYHYFEAPVRNYKGQKKWGQATFSKFPIMNKERINFPNAETNKAMVTDIDVCGQLVRVVNVHLQSVHFQEEQYVAIGNVRVGNFSNFPLVSFYEKLKDAFKKRGIQADLVAKHLRRSPYPVVVAGDFNDTPNSYTYRSLSHGMQDAYWQAGRGLGATYNGPIPGLRIDHMLVDQYIKVQQYQVIQEDIADHFPIKSTIGIPME